jgi:hypothetical protein
MFLWLIGTINWAILLLKYCSAERSKEYTIVQLAYEKSVS